MNNEIKINVPEGMEIDKENSTFECIKFKPKWVPKRGEFAAVGNNHSQIILVAEYIKPDITGFDIRPLALLSKNGLSLYNDDSYVPTLWVSEEAYTFEKESLINELKKKGYTYDPNDPRVIYKKEKELPKTWEEFCKNNPRREGEYFIDDLSKIAKVCTSQEGRDIIQDANVLPSKEYAEAMLALCKLIQLRDCYNDGWKPNWNGTTQYHCIYFAKGNVELFVRNTWSCILAFKSRELRNEFYNNFKDLIEQAKLLL